MLPKGKDFQFGQKKDQPEIVVREEDAEDDEGSQEEENVEEDAKSDEAEDVFYDEDLRNVYSTQFNESQSKRFQVFREKVLDGAQYNKIKDFASQVIPGITVSNNCKIILGVAGKVYVGELIEEAKRIMLERGENGTIEPHHLREARRRLKRENPEEDRLYESDMLG